MPGSLAPVPLLRPGRGDGEPGQRGHRQGNVGVPGPPGVDQADLLCAGPFSSRTKITVKIVRPRRTADVDLDSNLP